MQFGSFKEKELNWHDVSHMEKKPVCNVLIDFGVSDWRVLKLSDLR
jgi:hypothetical protein